jgi:hypothetical protein
MQVFYRSRVLLEVIIGILEPKRVLVKAVSACISHESDSRGLETVAEA